MQSTLQVREAEVETLKTSLRAAREAGRTVGGGGLNLFGGLAINGAGEAELAELETTLSRVEGALQRRGAWRKPPSDSAIAPSPRPLTRSGGAEEPPSSPMGRAGAFLTSFWEQSTKAIASASRQPSFEEGGSQDHSRERGDSTEATDYAAERRADEVALADIAATSRQLLAHGHAKQLVVRQVATTLAAEVARAQAQGGELARSLSLKLGEAEVERDQLKRFLRERLARLDTKAADGEGRQSLDSVGGGRESLDSRLESADLSAADTVLAHRPGDQPNLFDGVSTRWTTIS